MRHIWPHVKKPSFLYYFLLYGRRGLCGMTPAEDLDNENPSLALSGKNVILCTRGGAAASLLPAAAAAAAAAAALLLAAAAELLFTASYTTHGRG